MRQGNLNDEVEIDRYVTEGSFDAFMWQSNETKARFIGQVLTGDSTVRRADDIGGQELSYAEVKAIASGNPAVLTLAETDAALQRLVVLQKHHTDEQFLARRKLRELPVDIAALERRQAGLTQDIATAAAHARDPIIIGTRRCHREEALEALTSRLQALPALVPQTQSVPLGVYRGLRFGLTLHPHSPPEVGVEGAVTRYGALSREFHGPRAILNAVERIVGSYGAERDKAARDLSIAQTQQRDYEARLGAPFAHTGYLEELTGLRNQLEAALSGTVRQAADAPLTTTGEIAARIKTLQAAHTLEAAPARMAQRSAATVEESVTSRIRNRTREQPAAPAPEAAPLPPAELLLLQTPTPAPQAEPPRIIRPPVPARPPRMPPRQLPLF